ncbi:endonuclease/exonuclease/phosphatase family protein [Pontixanthobacter aquaemixtae]|uniref:Endonuclease n=1 Tax=Pontixanthobacter aquaemixtae TaxID=1958940 RepID=A0A844ZVP5_9SPHN|nr:endonuclease/exonuclease/phosphatase family protein [Pontixanthobacter aquaemixtae]MXO91250.1 endonuclease [Pontixanthobacter aquaemixtae]
MRLKFASYNIHKAVGTDGRRDPERILAVLREINADIIALQEADARLGQRASVLAKAALDETPWKFVPVAKRPRSIGWHGNALLVRKSYAVLDAEPLDLPRIEPRGAVRADIEVGGARIRVAGMHLDLSGLRRRAQIVSILKHVDTCGPRCPTVLMGDFNQWGNRTGAMRKFHPDWHILETGRSFPSRQPVARLDRIVTCDEWGCLEQHVHHSATAAVASDHLPVVASLELPRLWAVHNN